MKLINILFMVLLFVYFSFTSCVTNKKLRYLQTDTDSTYILQPVIDTIVAADPDNYMIQPFDNLYIRVMTPDPQWAEMFNTFQTSSSVSVTEQSANLISYSVNDDGTIDFPYVGSFKVAGKTVQMIRPELEKALQSYVSGAAVTVKLLNNYVSLIGEVQRPGNYPIYKDRMNVFQALSMAGDLSEFSNRQKIQIIRPTPEGNIIVSFSMNDRSIMSSEFYFVNPNDIIYAEPMEGKFFRLNSFPYAVILSTITTFILVLNYIQ